MILIVGFVCMSVGAITALLVAGMLRAAKDHDDYHRDNDDNFDTV